MFYFTILPIVVSTIFSYLSLTFFKLQPFPLFFALISGPITSLFLFKSQISTSFKKSLKLLKNIQIWPSYLLMIGLLAIIGLILSPLVRYPHIDQTTFVMFTNTLDYYKHLYLITAITNQGLPPTHPYFYPGNLSYYYGYYIIPSAITILTSLPQTTILYFWVLITTAISLNFLFLLYKKYLSSPRLLFLTVLILVTGLGLDIIPTKLAPPGFMTYIELWAHEYQIGPAVNNLYTAFLWVPQHILAATVTLFIIYKLLKKRIPSISLLLLLYTFVFLTSIFVGFTLILWSIFIFIFKQNTRKTLIFSAIGTTILLIPFISHLGHRGNILNFYFIQPFKFFNSFFSFLNYPITIIVEYGLLTFALPIFFFLYRKQITKHQKIVLLAIFFPIIISLFIKSSRANDFSMRSLHPTQMVLPLIIVLTLKNLKSKAKIILIILILITLTISSLGLFYEYKARWQGRFILDPYVSELLLKIRQMPKQTKLAVIGKDDWIFQIPPLGFKTILTPSLYDSGVYLIGNQNQNFESDGLQIFSQQIIESTPEKLVNQRNKRFNQLNQYLNQYPYDYLLLDNKIWIQQDVNPWLIIFQKLQTNNQPLTDRFTLFSKDSLLTQTQKFTLSINSQDPIEINLVENKAFTLPSGVWFLSTCAPNHKELKLELEQFYTVFNYFTTVPECIGNLFYYPPNTPEIILGQFNTVQKLTAYPLKITPN